MRTLIAAACVVLSACAGMPEGVKMTDQERVACARSQDCTVWTEAEIRGLIELVYRRAMRSNPMSNI